MKNTTSILLIIVLCATLFSGCQTNNVDSLTTAPWSQPTEASEASDRFDSVEQMKEAVDGIWMNCKTGSYIIISDGKLVELDDTTKELKLTPLARAASSFDDFYIKISQVCGEEIQYDCGSGSVILRQTGAVFFEMSDEGAAFNADMIMFIKENNVDYVKEGLLEGYIEAVYPNILTNKDAQYDKYGNLGKNFMISGVAELDDYYNWGYRGFESAFFCINIRPNGGNYSDEWYIYASRDSFSELFEALKEGNKDIRIIAKMEFADTGTNNMATLVNYFD